MYTLNFLIAMLVASLAMAQSAPVLVLDETGKVLLKDTASVSDDRTPRWRGLELYFSQSFLHSNPRALNERFAAVDYPTLSRLQLVWGIGGHYRINRYMLGMELAFGVNMFGPRGNDNAQVKRATTIIHFYNGFTVYRDARKRIYPLLGLSGTINDLHLTQPLRDVTDFNTVITTQGNGAAVSHVKTGINMGMGVDWTLEHKPSSPYVSLHVVYRHGDRTPWHSIYNDFTNAPVDRMSAIYLQMRVGIGWNRDKRQPFIDLTP